jgi:hypothetical protein
LNAVATSLGFTAARADEGTVAVTAISGTMRRCITEDLNGDALITPADLFFLASHIFAGGPAPVTPADVNGDGIVDRRDVEELARFFFAAE